MKTGADYFLLACEFILAVCGHYFFSQKWEMDTNF